MWNMLVVENGACDVWAVFLTANNIDWRGTTFFPG
jgi:hypothetical protein